MSPLFSSIFVPESNDRLQLYDVTASSVSKYALAAAAHKSSQPFVVAVVLVCHGHSYQLHELLQARSFANERMVARCVIGGGMG